MKLQEKTSKTIHKRWPRDSKDQNSKYGVLHKGGVYAHHLISNIMIFIEVNLLCSPCLCTPPIPPVTNTGMPT